MTETMTVHEALSELKVLGSRIEKEIGSCTFCITNKHSNTKINGKTIKDYTSDVVSRYQKITDLIKRRTAIKKAVVKSNAITEITIGNETMTVAEAIEYRNVGISFIEDLMNSISNDYNIAMTNLRNANGDVLEGKANAYINGIYGSKDSADNTAIEKTRKSYIEENTLDFIDPIGVEKAIQELYDRIDMFNSKVDSALSVSNARTEITINY